MNAKNEANHDYLKRLPVECYRGRSYVHWSMTIEQRNKGWLCQTFHHKFREILTHTTFRYGLTCPVYCCMPDHIHLLWIGILEGSDQRVATKYFRKHLNPALEIFDTRFQKQAYDHVLLQEERMGDAFENVVSNIFNNPVRAELVKTGCHQEYPFTGCLIPGFPELNIWQNDYWERFWRTYEYMKQHGLIRLNEGD